MSENLSYTFKYINMDDFHFLQRDVLKKLSLKPKLHFKDLLNDKVESEHMNYHIKKLVDMGYVNKDGFNYSLTIEGKKFVDLVDSESNKVEKMPKVAVIIFVLRKNKGVVEQLSCKRLKQPFYGKIGRLTGKVKFGETIETTAKRELREETGLVAKNVRIFKIYRKMSKNKLGDFVQDAVFFLCALDGISGTFIEKTEFQENLWIRRSDLNRSDLDFFNDYDFFEEYPKKELWFEQVEFSAEKGGY